jgi:ATP-dependent Clp protease ATP-binding subunit ClpA
LIGAPRLRRFDQGGQLTEAITKHPYARAVMDEIEKAHPDIFNILLQVMDHGTLTDNNGRRADFRNVTLIMTTNAGADQLAKSNIGFTSHKEAGDEMGEIKRMFTPEFRNRLDAVISFSTLDHEVILKVVDKFLLELENQLHERKVDASFTPNLKAFLAKRLRSAYGRAADGASHQIRFAPRWPTNCCSASWSGRPGHHDIGPDDKVRRSSRKTKEAEPVA